MVAYTVFMPLSVMTFEFKGTISRNEYELHMAVNGLFNGSCRQVDLFCQVMYDKCPSIKGFSIEMTQLVQTHRVYLPLPAVI